MLLAKEENGEITFGADTGLRNGTAGRMFSLHDLNAGSTSGIPYAQLISAGMIPES